MLQAHKRHYLVLAMYLGLTLLMTMPLAWRLTSHVAGAGGDPWQTMWRFEEKAAGGWQEFMTDLTGRGEPRLVNLSVLPWIWAQFLFGQPAAYNIAWLLSFVLAGYGMYLLAAQLLAKIPNEKIPAYAKASAGRQIPNDIPAFLAGVVYMFLPYRVAHAQGHFGAMQTAWLPLIMWLVVRWVSQPTWLRTAGLAALIAIQAWTEHHYMLWLLVVALIASWFFRDRLTRFWREQQGIWYALALVGMLLVLVVMPYMPTIRLALADNSPLELGAAQTIRFSADTFAYLTPASFHPLWGRLSYFLFGQHFTGNLAEQTHFLGLLPLLLVIFFWRSIPAVQRTFWGSVAGVFLLLSFGPRLHILGLLTPLPLPFAAVGSWPLLSSVRAVARASVMVGLAWVVLLAFVWRTELKRRGAAVVVLGIILLEFLFVPAPTQSVVLPAAYAVVRQSEGAAIVEIPAATNYTVASQALYGSRVHGKSVVGNIALERALTDADLLESRSLPVLRQLLFLRTTHLLENRHEFFDQAPTETLVDVLRWLDARVILVHRDSLTTRQLAAVQHLLEPVAPGEDAGEEILYRIPVSAQGDGVFLSRDERWQVGYDQVRGATFAHVSSEAGITLYNVTSSPKEVRLVIERAEESEGSLRISKGNTVLYEEAGGLQPITVTLPVSPGTTQLEFTNRLPGPVILKNPRLLVP
ncbi:MAG TPA: hypothetical protein VJC05_01195 [Candidatus Andersenbacteria bacterium]|nr:MAG: hypothetical protein A2854_02055 [Parcubacteria group bacterium RIFCSPHIGHO2_01_FULL_56_18]HLD25642.1 hypothetical protein [Candidatus Andersenbacteria bacterium]